MVEAVQGDRDAGPPAPFQLSRAIRFCVMVFLVARVAVSAIGVIAVEDQPPMFAAGFPAGSDQRISSGLHNAIDGTVRWDAGWFILVASSGYDPDDGSAEFYPAFPLVVRGVAALLPIGPEGSAILVANLSFLFALVVLYVLTTREYDERIARRSIVLLAAFPASLAFFAPYSESLFLLASVTAFLAARTDRWPSAALAGIVATATRVAGLILIPSLLVEAATSSGPTSRRVRFMYAVIPCIGVLGYLAYWQIRSGDASIPLRAPVLWERTLQFAPTMIGRALALGLWGVVDRDGLAWTGDLVLTAAVVVPLLVGWRMLRTTYLTYAVITLVAVVTVAYPPRPLVGAPRYLAVLFPAFWILACRLTRRGLVVVVGLFVAISVVTAVVFMNQRTFVF